MGFEADHQPTDNNNNVRPTAVTVVTLTNYYIVVVVIGLVGGYQYSCHIATFITCASAKLTPITINGSMFFL